ncbi:MAG: bifunctional acetate--CoA ligase family protein/GNAT family N-acetyltransferase [Syntrophobacterales bacterium]|jgi:acetyltransferase
MEPKLLDYFFRPASVAVVGASTREGSVGHILVDNLQKGDFPGQIYPINPKATEILGAKAYPSLTAVGAPVDLAVICIPIKGVPEIIKECGQSGIKAAVIISAGGKEAGDQGQAIDAAIHEEARQAGVRYLGPNCMGLLCPQCQLNASFAAFSTTPGSLAFISQSGALGSAILGWATQNNIGFSHFVSVGTMADLDFADLIDYLGGEMSAKSILIYMEGLTSHRRFMSAARAVSRIKPIILAKSGRSEAGARAAASHTGAMTGLDEAYTAAFRRAGIIRVGTVRQLFDCAEALGKAQRPVGGGLGIITNAGGPGVMAIDALSVWGAEPAALSPETLNKLDEMLPPFWSRGNPVDILGDATDERYFKALQVCLKAPELSGLVVIMTHQAMTNPSKIAQVIVPEIKKQGKPVLAVWMGGEDVTEGMRILNEGGVPAYETPEQAIDTFMAMYSYTRNLELLQETPARLPRELAVNQQQAETYIQQCLKRQAQVLTEIEAKAILAAYGIPVTPTISASTSQAAARSANHLGYPVVMKIHSPQITHKTDVGGVKVGLTQEDEVKAAFDDMTAAARSQAPEAQILGVTLQPLVKPVDFELILGAKKDPQFGPLILFGLGGTYAEVLKDVAVELPPLNLMLAERLLQRTQVYRLLSGYRRLPAADLEKLEEIIMRLAQLVTDFPEIVELDINPLFITRGQPLAGDARMVVEESPVVAPRHLIIAPYPNQYVSDWMLEDGTPVKLRPMRPEDEPLVADFLAVCSDETIYFRYFRRIKRWTHDMLIRFTQNDYDREIGIMAVGAPPGPEVMMGVSRLVTTPDRGEAEFAIIVADAWHGRGLGSKLIQRLIEVARDMGVKKLWGAVLSENHPMLALAQKHGFTLKKDAEGETVHLEMTL